MYIDRHLEIQPRKEDGKNRRTGTCGDVVPLVDDRKGDWRSGSDLEFTGVVLEVSAFTGLCASVSFKHDMHEKRMEKESAPYVKGVGGVGCWEDAALEISSLRQIR